MRDRIELSIGELKTVIKRRLINQVKDPASKFRPLYIEGHAGIGKTQSVVQAAREMSDAIKQPVDCKILSLQFCERPDFMGLPTIMNGETTFARPSILPKDGFGILFLDEANRVDVDIRSGMLTLLEDRSINGHRLGDGWIIVLAGNPAETEANEGQYEVSEFDTALLDRVSIVKAVGNHQEHYEHIKDLYPKSLLVKFLEINPGYVSFSGVGVTPRTFEYAVRSTLEFSDINDKNFHLNLAIDLGVYEASLIQRILQFGFIPSLDKIKVGDPRSTQFFKEFPDRKDVIIKCIDEIANELLMSKKEMNKEEATRVADFINSLPGEMRNMFGVKITSVNASTRFKHLFAHTSIAGLVK